MSGLYDLTAPGETLIGGPANVGDYRSLTEIIGLAYSSDKMNYSAGSKAYAQRQVIKERDDLYEKLTGESIAKFNTKRQSPIERRKEIDAAILELRNSSPDVYGGLKTYDEIEVEARKRAVDTLGEYNEAVEYRPGVAKYGAMFTGSMGAMVSDLSQLPLLTFGAQYGMGTSFLKAAAIEGAAGALSEAAIQPDIMSWQQELGNKYGLGEAALATLFGGVGGAAISLPISAAVKVRPRLSSAMEMASQAEGVTPKLKAAIRELARPMQRIEDSPSPDLPRHHSNADLTESRVIDEGRMPDVIELNARITDDIDGIPAQAFDFLDPEKVTSDGVTTVKRLTAEQVRSEVEKEMLPRIAKEIEQDLSEVSTEAADLALDNIAILKDRLGQLNKKMKKALKRLDDIEAREKVSKKYTEEKFDIDNEIAANQAVLDTYNYNMDRGQILDQVKAGKLPKGNDQASVSVRGAIDRIVKAIMENKKLAPKRTAMEKRLADDGVIPPQREDFTQAEELADEVDLENMEDAIAIGKEIEAQTEGSKYVDEDGNLVDSKRLIEDAADKAEMEAVRTCAKPGGAE